MSYDAQELKSLLEQQMTMASIDRFKALREEYGVIAARRLAQAEAIATDIANATTVEDLKPILFALLHRSMWQ